MTRRMRSIPRLWRSASPEPRREPGAGIRQAIFAYNHSQSYVTDALAWAARYTSSAPSSTAAAAIAFAVRQVGKPYQWGAAGPGAYDCSGLVYGAYAAAGIRIARTTYQWRQDGPQIPLTELEPGDLLFSAGLRRHSHEPRPCRDVPRRRPDHPGPADRRGRPDRPPRPGRGRGRHPPRRPHPPRGPAPSAARCRKRCRVAVSIRMVLTVMPWPRRSLTNCRPGASISPQ